MALRLRVVSIHAQLLGEEGTRTFGVHGGSIGRASDNDWILPDPDRYISGHHARIEYRNGQYWLMDTSSNGTYLNDSASPLSNDGPHALHGGTAMEVPPAAAALASRFGARPLVRWLLTDHPLPAAVPPARGGAGMFRDGFNAVAGAPWAQRPEPGYRSRTLRT